MRKRILNLATCCFAFFLCFGIIPSAGAEELRIFVGAGLRQPVDQLVQEFQEQTGHFVFADYGGSGQLLTKIEAASKGDLFIPGSLFYIEKLEKAGRIQSSHSVVYHTPVIGVNARQAQRLTIFEDLAKPGIRLAMGDPKAMALGRTALSILEKSGMKEAILKNVTVYGATVNQLALYVSQGAVDAAIIGRSNAFQDREKIVIVPIPQAYFQSEIIAVAIPKSATNPDLASILADYLSSDHAVKVFQQYGFLPLER